MRVRSSALCESCRVNVHRAKNSPALKASLCGDCSPGGRETAEVIIDDAGVSRSRPAATDGGQVAAFPSVGGHVTLDRTGDRPRVELSVPAVVVGAGLLVGTGLAVGWWLA